MTKTSLLCHAAMAAAFYVAPILVPVAQTIVGTWAPDPHACMPVAGLIEIGPKSLTADETRCTFRDVARERDVVTWHGTCSDGVAAAIRYGALTVLMNGRPSGTNRRCTPA